MRVPLLLVFYFVVATSLFAQSVSSSTIRGTITAGEQVLPGATVTLINTRFGTATDSAGVFQLADVPTGTYQLSVSLVGYDSYRKSVRLMAGQSVQLSISLREAANNLNEVVVTGARATELRKSPVAIAVITRKEMNLNANTNAVDAVLKGVPGLSAVTTGPNVSKPFIRGLGYNRVLTLYNGVRQEGQQWGDEHGIEVDQYGIERAEVIKGPASLIYGSDAVAGVINFIPYIPRGAEGKVNGDVVGEYHTNNGMIGTSAGLSYTKNGWKAAFRASNKLATAYTNPVDGRVYGTGYRELNLSAMTGVEKRWGSSFLYATLYNNLQEIPDGSRDSLTRRFTRQVLESDQDDIRQRPLVPENELRTYRINPLHQHIQHSRLFTRNRFLIGKSDLSVLAGFQQSVRREYNHPTVPEQPGLYVRLNTINYEVKYNLPIWRGFEPTLGVNGMYQTNKNLNGTDFPIPDYALLDIGSFLFVKKTIGAVDISGGMRYDTRSVDWGNQYVQNNPATGFDQLVYSPTSATATPQFAAYSRSFTGMSGSLGATYNISERLLVKANLSRGYRAPNITEIGSNGLDPGARIVYLGNRNFQPEFSLQTDIGFIGYLNDMDVSVELFNNVIDNYIYQARLYDDAGQPVVIVPGNFTYQYQQSKAQLYGAEFSLNLHPRTSRWLTINNSLALIRGLNRNPQLIELEGDAARYLPFIPPLHGRSEIRATFGREKARLSGLYVRAELDYYGAQNRFYGVDNTETATPGYALVNAGFGGTINNRQNRPLLQLFFQVDNLFNVAYQSHLNRLKYFEYYTASPTGRFGIYNVGRNASVKVIVPF
ncbi:TonB-dependent receptor [Spirosoma rhododendri]|uniref:TonB-dependent receptor n=1 Tax=Spirosoma rhododendri TaxID=2728024 RepID=A0A7L5DHQ1_9BACT|nr:TonB-dependent receptor [Spirosoma rhododendri]QJD77545.1 TonB-dependent receptor [Spirosoma rhododendri]